MLKRLLLVAILFAPQAYAAISIQVTPSFDDSVNSQYRGGDKPIPSASCTTWTFDTKGDAAGECDEEDATALTLTCSSTNDLQPCFATQTVASGDFQMVACQESITGWQEAFTGFGVYATEGTADADYIIQNWFRDGPANAGFKHGIPGSTSTEETGPGSQTRPFCNAITHDVSLDETYSWTSINGGSTWTQLGTVSDDELTYPLEVGVMGTSHHVDNSTSAVFTDLDLSATIDIYTPGDPDPPPDPGPRQLKWYADFETGSVRNWNQPAPDSIAILQIAKNGTFTITGITRTDPAVFSYSGTGDPFLNEGLTVSGVNGMTQINGRMVRAKSINTTANTFVAWQDNEPQGNGNGDIPPGAFALDATAAAGFSAYTGGGTLQRWTAHSTSTTGGAGPGVTNLPIHVVESGTVSIGTDANVEARVGNYFVKTIITYNWPYNVHQSNDNVNKNKPRHQLNIHDNNTAFDWNEEFWIGMSLYVPSDIKVDTEGSDHRWTNMILTIVGRTASTTHLTILQDRIGTTPAFAIRQQVRDDSVSEGEFIDDTKFAMVPGAWNDIIVRYKSNPFGAGLGYSCPVNPHDDLGIGAAVDEDFACDTGITQIWIGEAGEELTLVVNTVDAPVGLVPEANAALRTTIRNYKYGWHFVDTSFLTDIEYGFDEIRLGSAPLDGTGYSDVHPDQAAQP